MLNYAHLLEDVSILRDDQDDPSNFFLDGEIPEDLEEGDDVYFSCSISANPPAYKITWWHNVSAYV